MSDPRRMPRRMVGYIRVSRVGDRDVDSESYITEKVQRDKIETWAKLRGVEIGWWFVDRDASGAKLSRPGFDKSMDLIAAGTADGIVVAAIDRLSRADVADALMIVRKIMDEYGGTVAAVDLGIDPTTEVGEMLLTVLLALARMQWRRYAAAWVVAKERAIKRGAHVGPTPLGYERGKDGRLERGKDSSFVAAAFTIAKNKGVLHAARYLSENLPERTWTATVTKRLLSNRVYLGEVRIGPAVNPDAHEPLVDLATWTAANKRADTDARTKLPSEDYPLTRVARCASCGDGLVGMRHGRDERGYGCRRNRSAAARRGRVEACPAPAAIFANRLEEFVQSALLRYVATERPDDTEVLVEGTDDRAVDDAESNLRSAEMRRDADARDLRLRDVLGADVFYERMEAHNAAVAAAQAAYEAAVEASAPRVEWPLTDEIATANTSDLPRLLERAGVEVRVKQGRGDVTERVALIPAA